MNAGKIRHRVNWPQAVAEVVLIIAGILGALAVDSWWDEQAERSAEIEYLRSLRADLLVNRETLNAEIEFETGILAHGDEVLSNIRSGLMELTEADFTKKIGAFLYTSSWTPTTGTYDELVASGRLLYIQNADLRIRLATYSKLLEQVPSYRDDQNTFWFSSLSPFIRDQMDFSSFEWIGSHESKSPFPDSLDKIETQELWNLFTEWRSLHYLAIDGAYGYRKALLQGEKIIELVNAELARTAKKPDR